VTLYDYERIVGDDGKRLLAFGKFAGRSGFIDFLHGLGKRMYLDHQSKACTNIFSCMPVAN